MSVTVLSMGHVGEIVSVLADAFHDYPVMRNVLGADGLRDENRYDERLHRLVELFVSGRAYRAEPMLGLRDDSGRLIGTAIMSLPTAQDPPAALMALRESIWGELGADARARYEAYASAAGRSLPALPHHHLNMIGVRRSVQGRGLARPLLAAVHDLAAGDERSAGVSLATERAENVELYEHFGYRVLGHARVGPNLETWGMFRSRHPERSRARALYRDDEDPSLRSG